MVHRSLNGAVLSLLNPLLSSLCLQLPSAAVMTGIDALLAFKTRRCRRSRSDLTINAILRSDPGHQLAPLARGKSPPGSSKNRRD